MARESQRRPHRRSPLDEVDVINLERVDISRLSPVGVRPTLGRYLWGLHQRRHFIWADSRARAFSGNKDTILGNLWLIGRPILDGFAFYIIFGVILGTSRGVENYIGFLLVGVFLFSFVSRSLTGGAGVMKAGSNLIKAFSFPRAAIPLALLIRETLSMIPVIVTMLLMITVIPPHAVITWRWALFPVVFVMLMMFNAGLIFYAARLTSAIPDLKHVLSFISRFWLYGSGVMFSLDRFITHPTMLEIVQLNPAYCAIELSRELLVYGTTPDLKLWFTLGAWAVVTPLFGFLYFWQAEEEYGRA
ncbi:ABC transporter permease [Intrasporangium calvum]|uniref:ABC transporter permease n=1 Tax=Intrasporangium calvum TaxID=53358 RepID=A0ABT5GJG9_9MICO|nr:ABC transporter permease [Intrasporangium calvum]MDC5698347.1 ABC transporter permease [Intrasporangium calvum]